MGFRNEMKTALRDGKVSTAMWNEAIRTNLLLMAPFAPHITEELWEIIGGEYSIHNQTFPAYNEEKAKDEAVELVIMIQGKPRGTIPVSADISKEDAIELALNSEITEKFLNGSEPKKIIFIPGRTGQPEPKVNIVI
jgi:leucyl-tRNA synthetase